MALHARHKLYLSWLVYDADEVTLFHPPTAGQGILHLRGQFFNENGITPGKTFKLEG